MYLNGKIIATTANGEDIFCEYDRHCDAFIYTAAEYDDNGEIAQVYGLYPDAEGKLYYQNGNKVQFNHRG